MALPIVLSKLKTFFPVLLVGGAVAITIKLLTASNTLSSQIIKVNAEEDIVETKHEEILEEEKVPEPQPEEALPKEAEPQEPAEDQDEENNGNQEESEATEKEQKPSEDEEKPKVGRSLITDTLVGATLQEILKE